MKLQRLAVGAALLTSSVGTLLAPVVASADTKYEDATHAQTTGTITFSADTEPTKPVNPGDNETPVEPDKDINPNGAELMITYASNLNFGTQSKSDTSWNAYADKLKDGTAVVPFVSVKDSRGSDRDGWKLTVKQDDVFKNNGVELKGAQLKFSNLNYAGGADTLPKAVSGAVTLSGKAQLIASADQEHGAGNTSLALGKLQSETDKSGSVMKTPGVNLSIKNGTVINTGAYSTTITYELTAGA